MQHGDAFAAPSEKYDAASDFVTVVAVDPILVDASSTQPFVTILSIGTEDGIVDVSDEEVLVYRLPGERLGFGLKFDGGSNAADKVAKVMIQSCAADSPASRTSVSWGHFQAGDEILEIERVSVTQMTRLQCVRALKESSVCLKLRVRKGNKETVRSGNTSDRTTATPPPVPPRKYPRRGVRVAVPIVRPADGFNDVADCEASAGAYVPEAAETNIDLVADENSVTVANVRRGHTLSAMVDVHLSTPPATFDRGFTKVRSVGSGHLDDFFSAQTARNRDIDLDRMLQPFLQLEREFSSCATIRDNDLLGRLVAAASLKETSGAAAYHLQDMQRSYQQIEEDVNNNSLKANDETLAGAVYSDEQPPKPLPRKEIAGKVLVTKYGKKRPPPPPPCRKSNRCPSPNREYGHHESSDSNVGVDDRLPRLIDFVPKDRSDLIAPNAVHPSPVDMLLERQRILSIVSQNKSVENVVMDRANDGHPPDRSVNDSEPDYELVNASQNDKPSISGSSAVILVEQNDEDNEVLETQPNEMSTQNAKCIDIEDPLALESKQVCLTIGSPNPLNYKTLPTNGEDTGKMKPPLQLSTTVKFNLPKSPPPHSRMPPDGHEFPQNYQELDPNSAAAAVVTAASTLNAAVRKSTDSLFIKKSSYTDVFNEAKLLDVERFRLPQKQPPSPHTKNRDAPPNVQSLRYSQLWRNDERSERSVKDKIAMFSNVIQKSAPPYHRPLQNHSEDVSEKRCKGFSKSVFSIDTVGTETSPVAGYKSKGPYCPQRNVDPTTHVNINRTQSSVDLTLFSSSCSSAYSSCSPDSSLSPMSSPSYTVGSSSTLPRKHKSPIMPAVEKRSHAALARATSFAGTGGPTLHCRSQSLVDVLYPQTDCRPNVRKDSLTALIEQRRRTISKLRGLVIPEKEQAVAPLKPIIDLPEIKCKEVPNGVCPANQTDLPKPSKNGGVGGVGGLTYVDYAWKSVLNYGDIPKYSPAFKRKTLTVYGVSSSASSLSSSLNSSREELRDNVKKCAAAPAKPPRCYTNQLVVYGPTLYKSLFSGRQNVTDDDCSRKDEKVEISRNDDTFKSQEDSDNDSAVSSSRSSLCQEYSPPSSPSPNGTEYESGANEPPSHTNSRTSCRTLPDANVSLTSSVSTLTPSSDISNTSNEELFHEQSKRILKAESVEAINRKNVLSSAKYSCGKDFKIGSPLIKDVFEDAFKECNLFEYEKVEENRSTDSLKMEDGDESDFSAKENSSSAETDEALDKSLDSTDSLCGNYRTEYNVDAVKKESNDRYWNGEKTDTKYLNNDNSGRTRGSLFNGQRKHSVNDIKKTFEKEEEEMMKSRSKMILPQNHLRMSSTDSTTSEDSFPYSAGNGLNVHLSKEQQFGSITSLASSTSLISQQELQQLIDEANQTLEETAGSGEHDLMVVILHRDTVVNSIGITLAGGADYEAKEITVHKILVGSPADKDGRIQKGDRILSINGRNMKGVTHREALSILKTPRPEVVLVVSRWRTDGSNGMMPATMAAATNALTSPAEDPLVVTFKTTLRPPRIPEIATDCDKNSLSWASYDYIKTAKGPISSVTLMKEGGGLGFSLEGGKDSPFGDLPLTIKKIFTGGCAAKSGALSAGDELISLNGIDVTAMSRTEAWNMMKRLSDGQVVLSISRSPLK